MDKMLDDLREYGADIDGIMGRFVGDMGLYKTCFETFLKDETFRKLGEALKAESYEEAFDFAHTLKGTSGNMGLTPLYKLISALVEDMRNKDYTHIESEYSQISAQMKVLEAFDK